MSEDISDSELYYNRRSEAALCRDFPADAPIIDALYRWQMQIWNSTPGFRIPVLRVMNCAHRVAARMVSGLFDYDDRNGYDYSIFKDMDYDQALMSIVIVVLVSMLRCIEDSERARTCISIITDDRPEDFYERLSLFNDYMNSSCKIRCREKDLLQDSAELVERIAQLEAEQQQNKNTIQTLNNQLKTMEATQNNQFNGPVYQGCTFSDSHDTYYGTAPVPTPEAPAQPTAGANEQREERFKYIHYKITDEAEQVKIHKMVCNIVRLPKMQQVCDALVELMREEQVLSTIDQGAMLAELRRLGLPADKKGFSDQNFYSFYRTK